MPVEKALAILDNEKDSGQFDPQLIREFITMMRAEHPDEGTAAAS
jgi:response regulator RpfG family c-di-GMP phosphodiesterase